MLLNHISLFWRFKFHEAINQGHAVCFTPLELGGLPQPRLRPCEVRTSHSLRFFVCPAHLLVVVSTIYQGCVLRAYRHLVFYLPSVQLLFLCFLYLFSLLSTRCRSDHTLLIPLLHRHPGMGWIVFNLIADRHFACLSALLLKTQDIRTGRAIAMQIVFWGVRSGRGASPSTTPDWQRDMMGTPSIRLGHNPFPWSSRAFSAQP